MRNIDAATLISFLILRFLQLAETNNPEYVVKVADKLKIHNDNFVVQSDFGIIEVEEGEIIYNNIK